jgi:hypothetical protein
MPTVLQNKSVRTIVRDFPTRNFFSQLNYRYLIYFGFFLQFPERFSNTGLERVKQKAIRIFHYTMSMRESPSPLRVHSREITHIMSNTYSESTVRFILASNEFSQ